MARGAGNRAAVASGAGLGLRPELSADLLLNPRSVDFVEVVVEACFASPQARREAAAMAEVWPVVPHGIKLSLGSADGIEVERARRIGALARELRAPLISEHVAFVRGGSHEIGHLTPLPCTREAVKVVAANVAAARRHFPDVPLLLENIAWMFQWPGDSMSEADFYGAIVEATGCDLLLDLSNLYANAINLGQDPAQVLDQFPLERVAMVHLAGGVREHGFYFDTHAHAVPDAVFTLLDRLCARRGQVPVVIERDALFPPFAALEAEVARSRGVVHGGEGAVVPGHRHIIDGAPVEPALQAALLEAQRQLALMLTSLDEPPRAQAEPYGVEAMERSREVLRRKRIDDALPLLPRLSQRRDALEPLAYQSIAHAPRSSRLAAIADAMRIARSVEEHPALGPAARLDGLILQARFHLEGHEVRPRAAPFVRRLRLPAGNSVWVLKGPGAGASVRLIEPAARAT